MCQYGGSISIGAKSLANCEEDSLDGDSFVSQSRFDAYAGSISNNLGSIKTRSMKNFSEEAFLSDVASIDWEQALGSSDDANLLVQQFSNASSQMIEKHAPLRQIRVSEKYCPWTNSNLKNLIRARDLLKKSAVRHKSQHLMNSYK